MHSDVWSIRKELEVSKHAQEHDYSIRVHSQLEWILTEKGYTQLIVGKKTPNTQFSNDTIETNILEKTKHSKRIENIARE